MDDKELTEIEIDLSGDKLNESFLRMFGFGVKAILKRMFGGSSIPVTVKGNTGDVKSFAKAIGSEKKYLDDWRRYGLDNPRTYKSKYKLDKAVKEFSRKTGIQWPFK
jgi:hypothetical protein